MSIQHVTRSMTLNNVNESTLEKMDIVNEEEPTEQAEEKEEKVKEEVKKSVKGTRGRTKRKGAVNRAKKAPKDTRKKVLLTKSGKPRKNRRFRPGTRALMDIRYIQKHSGSKTDYMMAKAPFRRVVKDIIADVNETGVNDIRITKNAVEALYQDCQEYLTEIFREAQILACDIGGEIEVQPKHFHYARRVIDHHRRCQGNVL